MRVEVESSCDITSSERVFERGKPVSGRGTPCCVLANTTLFKLLSWVVRKAAQIKENMSNWGRVGNKNNPRQTLIDFSSSWETL